MQSFDLVHLSKTGIDLKTTGAITIQTTENGTQRFIPMQVVVECTAATSITIAASISIGTNSTNYDNLLGISSLTGVTTANTLLAFNLDLTAISSVAVNTAIKVNVTTAATGTSQTARVDIIGYYL